MRFVPPAPGAVEPAWESARPGRSPAALALALARGWFVRPPDLPGEAGMAARAAGSASTHELAAGLAARAPQPRFGVLAPPKLAHGVGACVALASAGSGVAIVASWCAAPRTAAAVPPVRAARRLAAELARSGLSASASGRLVTFVLPEDDIEAVDALRRAGDLVAPRAPVLTLAAPRTTAWDGVLLERDLVLVHGQERAIVALAVARLSAAGANARALDAPLSPPVRALAARGVALPGTLAPCRAAVRVTA